MTLLVALSSAAAAQDATTVLLTSAKAQAHIARAKAAAYEPGQDFTVLYDTVCAPALSERGPTLPAPQIAPPLATRRVPPRSESYTEPAKVFDNLYFIGSPNDSVWAVTTSEGIILVDTGYDYSIKESSDGLKTFGLDPAQIKYVVLSHAHGDRYFGARYLQDTYHPRIVMSQVDWTVMAKSNEAAELKPTKDMVATDGMKLTLGDTTLTLYVTPGHTPGYDCDADPAQGRKPSACRRRLGRYWRG